MTEDEIRERLYQYMDSKSNRRRITSIIDEQEIDSYEEQPKKRRGFSYREKPTSYLSDEEYDEWN